MKNKLRCLLAAVLVLFAATFSLTAFAAEAENGEETEKHKHTYEAEWTWHEGTVPVAQLTLTCTDPECDDSRLWEVLAVPKVTKPTCTKDGTVTWSADMFCFLDGNWYSDSITVDGEKARGWHKYGESDWVWADDCNTATLNLVCEDCDACFQKTVGTTRKVLKDADCTTPGKAEYTTETVTVPLVHEGTRNYNAKCEASIGVKGHDWEESWSWEQANAMTQKATVTLTCNDCHKTVSASEYVIKKETEPTCTKAGEISYSAVVKCEGKEWTDTLDLPGKNKLEHKFTNYVYNNDAKCGQDGTETAKCDYNCGTPDTRNVQGTALNHSFTNYVNDNNATCLADGTETATCDHGCGATDPRTLAGTKLEHLFTNYVSDGEGHLVAECDRGCGTKDVKNAPVQTVTYGEPVHLCQLYTVAVKHNGQTSTVKICPDCGKVSDKSVLTAVAAESNQELTLIVRAGTLANGKKVMVLAFENSNGTIVKMNGTVKVRIALAELNKLVGDVQTLAAVNTATGEQKACSFTVEDGKLVLDAAFGGNAICVFAVN